ncbi:MAG: methyltransferase domain-containing protein [Planctomycetota bacterium]|nr:MAG: methyltransferase domain-containing protein [Planctomycetota bacterium]
MTTILGSDSSSAAARWAAADRFTKSSQVRAMTNSGVRARMRFMESSSGRRDSAILGKAVGASREPGSRQSSLAPQYRGRRGAGQIGRAAAVPSLENVRFVAHDLTDLAESAAYDLVTAFDIVHDQQNPAAVLAAIYTALRPGGIFLMQDIRASSHVHENLEHPLGPLLYTISTMHSMTVSLAQDGDGLGAVRGEELAVEMREDAAFDDVRVETLKHDILNNYYVMTK